MMSIFNRPIYVVKIIIVGVKDITEARQFHILTVSSFLAPPSIDGH